MKPLRWRNVIFFIIVFAAISWLVLTLWAEAEGGEKQWTFGPRKARQRVLIVYDPDPFYNLDEQVCRAFGEAMADSGLAGTVATVMAARKLPHKNFDVYVFCANTYNWRPDWAVTHFIEQNVMIRARSVIAITAGAGSTEWSQKEFEKIIEARGGMLVASRPVWLLRPNDKSRMREKNCSIARDMIYDWALELVDDLQPYVKRDSL